MSAQVVMQYKTATLLPSWHFWLPLTYCVQGCIAESIGWDRDETQFWVDSARHCWSWMAAMLNLPSVPCALLIFSTLIVVICEGLILTQAMQCQSISCYFWLIQKVLRGMDISQCPCFTAPCVMVSRPMKFDADLCITHEESLFRLVPFPKHL